jgi:hypothetical protein
MTDDRGNGGDVGASTDSGAEQGTDDLARAGLEHLQAAAREAIQAARTLLDVAERVVDDPAAVQAAVTSIGTLAQAALHRLRVPDPPAGGRPDAGPDDGRVQRIRVS